MSHPPAGKGTFGCKAGCQVCCCAHSTPCHHNTQPLCTGRAGPLPSSLISHLCRAPGSCAHLLAELMALRSESSEASSTVPALCRLGKHLTAVQEWDVEPRALGWAPQHCCGQLPHGLGQGTSSPCFRSPLGSLPL